MSDQFDAVFYVKDAPTITFEDGHVHVVFRVGTHTSIEFVLSPNVYLRTHRAAKDIASAFNERDPVVEFRKGTH